MQGHWLKDPKVNFRCPMQLQRCGALLWEVDATCLPRRVLLVQGDWLKDVEDEFNCAVCQESIIAAHCLVPCGHCFCGNCLFQWLSRKQICPTCRYVAEHHV